MPLSIKFSPISRSQRRNRQRNANDGRRKSRDRPTVEIQNQQKNALHGFRTLMSALFGREVDVVNNCMRSASEVNQMADVAFFSRYGEGSRAVGFYSEPARGGRLYGLRPGDLIACR